MRHLILSSYSQSLVATDHSEVVEVVSPPLKQKLLSVSELELSPMGTAASERRMWWTLWPDCAWCFRVPQQTMEPPPPRKTKAHIPAAYTQFPRLNPMRIFADKPHMWSRKFLKCLPSIARGCSPFPIQATVSQAIGIGLLSGTCFAATTAAYALHCKEAPDDDVDWVSFDEVQKHNTRGDAWIVIDGKVYDVTDWISSHPGGAIIENFAGKDCTREFHSIRHSRRALDLQDGLHIANVKDYQGPPAADEACGTPEASQDGEGRPKMVIVGAGICGVAAAYFLSLSGRYDIQIVDKSYLVGGTALASSAILFLGGLVEKDDVSKTDLMTWTGHWQYDFMQHMHGEWEDIGFLPRGTLGVIQTQEQLEYLSKHLAPGGKMHGKFELLSRQEMLALEPHLNPDLLGATLVPKGAIFDPFKVCNAFLKRAAGNGLRCVYGLTVVGIERMEGAGSGPRPHTHKFRVLCTRDDGARQELEADVVLLCNGWQAGRLAGLLGHKLPVRGVHGQMFAMRHPEVTLRHNIYSWEGPHFWATHPRLGHQNTLDEAHNRLTRHLYGLQIAGGTLKFGGDRMAGDMAGEVVEAGVASNVEHVLELLPGLRGCPIIGTWSGTMPFVPDQKPLLGQLEDGLWVVTGSPFTKGASYAKLLSEYILGDTTHAHFCKDLDPLRFSRHAPQAQEVRG